VTVDIYNLTKNVSITNKYFSLELSIHHRILIKMIMVSTNNIKNIGNNKKCFLSSKLAY